ncbi:MAG: metal-dependent phosphohydrolase [Bacteroidota bacterium]
MIWDNWFSLASKIGLSEAQSADMQAIFGRYYGEKHRHYHNLDHVEALLTHIDRWPEAWGDPIAVQLAAWFHDIIYLPHKRDNEHQSARFAERQLATWTLPAAQITKISQMIIATAGHRAEGLDQDGRAFLDLDLSILGSELAVYQQYVASIRQEYRLYPNLIYRPARRKILRAFLERERLYFTPTAYERWEQAARANIQAELNSLA